MKKIIVILSLVLLVNIPLMADLFKVEAGAGVWINTATGEKTYRSHGVPIVSTSLENENTNPYVWAYIKQPIPLIPNLRLEYTELSSDYAAGDTLDITQYDIIPYYNLLDNTAWITLDLGLDIKMMEISTEPDNLALILLYTRVRVEIPGTNFGFETDAKFDGEIYDIRAKIDYTLNFIPLIQPAVEVGYRVQKLDMDYSDLDGIINLEFSGLYVGAMLRF